jgi:hypothetical protein
MEIKRRWKPDSYGLGHSSVVSTYTKFIVFTLINVKHQNLNIFRQDIHFVMAASAERCLESKISNNVRTILVGEQLDAQFLL